MISIKVLTARHRLKAGRHYRPVPYRASLSLMKAMTNLKQFNPMQRTRPRTKLEITPKEADFLRSNATVMTIKEMAEDLDVSESKVKDWLKELKIKRTRQPGS